MNSRAKMAILAFSLISLLLSPLAEAARMGKGRSTGMRRAAPTQPHQKQAAPAAPQPAPAQAPAQPQKQGPGIGTAIAAGAAGAAAGYMIGSATQNKSNVAPASAPATATPAPAVAAQEQAPQQPGIPWRWVLLLGAVFLIGLVWFRRRMAMPEHAPQAMPPLPTPSQPLANDNRFDSIPSIGSGFPSSSDNTHGAAFETRRLPDGTETPYFLRQAKGIFLHLQSLNSPDSLDEVRRYMTPDLFEELRHDIASNQSVADFTNLDCQLIESSEENGRIIASARFTGMVSEEVNAAPVPFSETWHFIKSADTNGKWMVAGIQQS